MYRNQDSFLLLLHPGFHQSEGLSWCGEGVGIVTQSRHSIRGRSMDECGDRHPTNTCINASGCGCMSDCISRRLCSPRLCSPLPLLSAASASASWRMSQLTDGCSDVRTGKLTDGFLSSDLGQTEELVASPACQIRAWDFFNGNGIKFRLQDWEFSGEKVVWFELNWLVLFVLLRKQNTPSSNKSNFNLC